MLAPVSSVAKLKVAGDESDESDGTDLRWTSASSLSPTYPPGSRGEWAKDEPRC